MAITSPRSAGAPGAPAAFPQPGEARREAYEGTPLPLERRGPPAGRPLPAGAAMTPAPRGGPPAAWRGNPARAGMPASSLSSPDRLQTLGRSLFGMACLGVVDGGYRMGRTPQANLPRYMVVASVLLGLIGDLLVHRAATHRGGTAALPGPGRLALQMLGTGARTGVIAHIAFTWSRLGHGRMAALPPDVRRVTESILSGMLGAVILGGVLWAVESRVSQLRRPDLRGLPVHQVILGFCDPESAAGRFDWKADGLFMDSLGRDMQTEVSHVLARIIDFAADPAGVAIAPALRRYLDGLATRPELRAALTHAAADANATCGDRVGLRLGELMLAESLDRATDPVATTPRDAVLTLVLHAAVRAMEGHIAQLMGPQQVPTADLMLTGWRGMQDALRSRGFDVPELFPQRLFTEGDDWRYLQPVGAFALSTADSLASSSCASSSMRPAAPCPNAVARLLREQGGAVGRAILDARLGHLSERLLADLQGQLEVLEDEKDAGLLDDQACKAAMDALKQAYDSGVAGLRERAIASALAGGTDGW